MTDVSIYPVEAQAPELVRGDARVEDLLFDYDEVRVKQVRLAVGEVGRYHVHQHAVNLWVVTAGTLEAIIGGVRYRVEENQLIFMPKNVPHATNNVGDGELRAIEIYAPSGRGDSTMLDLPEDIVDAS